MSKTSNETLEFSIILQRLANHALCEKAKETLFSLTPSLNQRECKLKMQETTDARTILETMGTPPLATMKDLDKILQLASKGSMLTPEQLQIVSDFLSATKRMKQYLVKAESLQVNIAQYGGSLNALSSLQGEIESSIQYDKVTDQASPTLRDLRRRIGNAHAAVKTKLETMLRGKKEWFMDGYVATRNGRFVLPVKKEHKHQVTGSVIDTSASGGTYFIEPTAVRKLQEELDTLHIEEDSEVRKILYTLTALVDEELPTLKINMDCMETLDFLFAKGRLSLEMGAIAVPITADRTIHIVEGRHPLLPKESCVPLNFTIGNGVQGVIVTGPNTGGKTVALKTVGLLSLMVQCGLHVPVAAGSSFCMHSGILCDIGDGQSITENLSTFSAHITSIISILNQATPESLVLLDELGSGTDPAEGMGIAISILEELRQKGCLFLATTHYPEIKDYAAQTSGLINARMGFDRESLQPLYQLQIGEAGESCALYIAKRLGFPIHMLQRAHKEAYAKRDTAEAAPPMAFLDALPTASSPPSAPTVSQIKKEQAPLAESTYKSKFSRGDSVQILPKKEIGIICKSANANGEFGVQIKGQKYLVGHKRLQLLVAASELYPEDYDFSVVFDTVENRKARHILERRHDADVVVSHDEIYFPYPL